MNQDKVTNYIVQGERLAVDASLHKSLNELAGRFYKLMGYTALPGHDYASSEHPQERMVYQMALEAAHMQQSTGELD